MAFQFQVDNDLIFDDESESFKVTQKPNSSSQDSKQVSVPYTVHVINQDPGYDDDDIKDTLFESLGHHLNRIKRDLFEWNPFNLLRFGSTSPPTESTSGSTSDTAADTRTKRNTEESFSTP